MKVNELIEQLRAFPPDADVLVPHTSAPYCWHEPQVHLDDHRVAPDGVPVILVSDTYNVRTI